MSTSSKRAPPDRPVRVRVLGGFVVEGFPERALGSRKARVLLKRLALAGGRPVATEELAAVVWGAEQPHRPADQVSVLVSRLRAVLGPERLPRSDGGYSLLADWSDLQELERCAAEIEQRIRAGENAAALAVAHAAPALISGELLPEDEGEWVDEVRPVADRLVARARSLSAEAALRPGELGAARVAAQAVLDRDPYDEGALRLLMQADALAGRTGSALAVYAKARHRLADDLGAGFGPETEALHTSILRGEFPLLTRPPAASSALVGRDREFELLGTLLDPAEQASATAVVLEAEPGMGKSALLRAWAARASIRALVIWGRCDELGGDLPLQAVTDGLVAHLEGLGREAASEVLGDEGTVLGPLLGRPLSGTSFGATTVLDAGMRKSALFNALATVPRRAAGRRPVVLIVDDLHQANSGTAEFLAFMLTRASGVMVVAARRPGTGPDLPTAVRVELGSLTLEDVVALVGPERGPALYERSGGHPLFLHELSAAPGDQELPASIVAAVRARLESLGDRALSLEATSCCAAQVDVQLISGITARPAATVLDDLEQATRAGLLRPREGVLAFSHELVREAIEAGISGPRRYQVHRAAASELARRPDVDPLGLARHARLGGEHDVASQALVSAASKAAERSEVEAALELVDQAINLADSAAARLLRGRLCLGALRPDAARAALAAIELGANVEGFELAGWAAYYARDHSTALRYAEEGAARATDRGLRASCLALAGRARHSRGDLEEASRLFQEALSLAPGGIRGMVQVWFAQLLTHQGQPEQAADLARRGLLDPHMAHPFVAGHGHFTLVYSLGLCGSWAAALEAVDNWDLLISRYGDKRFTSVAANFRGWLLRGAGLLEQSAQAHGTAVTSESGVSLQEAVLAGQLDLVECCLAQGRFSHAQEVLTAAVGALSWSGSMGWRHRSRYQLLEARLAGLDGRTEEGAAAARAVAAGAAERGDRRYHARALLVEAAIEATAGRPPSQTLLPEIVTRFLPVAGPDGWRDLGELGMATRSIRVWQEAEAVAARVISGAVARGLANAGQVAPLCAPSWTSSSHDSGGLPASVANRLQTLSANMRA